MSNLYKPTTHKAYQIAAAALQYELDSGVPQEMLKNEGKSLEEIEEIIKAYKRIIDTMLVKSR